jgi:hypothetical protein
MRFHSRINLGVWFLAIAGIPALLRAMPAGCPAPPLRSAASFAVLGRTVMSSGPSIVTGNLGVSSGTAAGFPPGRVNIGTTFHGDSTVQQAQNDATAAYGGLSCGTCTPLTNPNLGGMTLGPGVYCSSSPLTLTGTLILDAGGDPNAVWVFRTTGTLTTDANASVLVINGGWNGNVFWQAAGSVTLNASTTFAGNILTPADITLGTGVSVSGRLLAGGAVTLESNNVSLCCAPITLAPATPALPSDTVVLPRGTVGTAYSQTITASGGLAPYSFTTPPELLPPGLNLSTGGALSGMVPSKEGSYTFTVTATDSSHVCSGSQTYRIDVFCPTIIVSPPALPPAQACVIYTQTFVATGGTAPYTFSLSDSGLDGPTLSGPSLTWTPKKSGTHTFTVTATDKFGCSGSQIYEVVVACEAIEISPATLPYGQVCTLYNQPILASGCDPLYVLSLESGMLPLGLTGPLPGNAIVGTPRKPGTYKFRIKATDPDDTACFTTRDYSIVITCPVSPVITISPSLLPPATTTCQYCVQLTPSCAIGSPQFRVTDGTLPPGLTLSLDGMLCGKPLAAGTYDFTVTFTDSVSGCTGSVAYTLPVTVGVTLTPATLPGGWPGVPYSEVLTASGGTAPYTFVVSGTLPPGLASSATQPTLTISGTPTTVGCFPFTVTVTDFNGCSTSITSTICVATGAPTLSGWGMIVLSMLLVGAGFVMMQKGGIA